LPNVQTTIEILDPCGQPASIFAPTQTNPPDYFYTDAATIKVNQFIVDPPICQVTYECVSVEGPDPNVKCEDSEAVSFNS
jgi:hypothetical protein